MDMTQDQDRRVKTLRRELEGWREVLCAVHSVLVWEKHFYPFISISAVTTLFLTIWYIEPSMLTLLSVLGITVTLCDYLVPQIVPWIVGAHYWTGAHERRYEQIITSVACLCGSASYISNTLTSMKESKPRTYFVMVTGSLLVCAWVGNTINNLLLTYLIVVVIVLIPGMRPHGILQKYFSAALKTIAGLLKSSVSAVQGGGGGGGSANGDASKKKE
ncbi:ADP-ribosylation factor-like protein 6-interacting protein 1 [Homarus americanus]|uniref:ADP-ribosylation factor-like protein 6-interacting protein 1 n=1 Tax=Homarus americanus TaxID=6706 RepID=UPI001C487463|nr:ADP-ribosylation factor-like protein 6-interacting protein 1 [Homarus americanus]